jgi:hypothetical protein
MKFSDYIRNTRDSEYPTTVFGSEEPSNYSLIPDDDEYTDIEDLPVVKHKKKNKHSDDSDSDSDSEADSDAESDDEMDSDDEQDAKSSKLLQKVNVYTGILCILIFILLCIVVYFSYKTRVDIKGMFEEN